LKSAKIATQNVDDSDAQSLIIERLDEDSDNMKKKAFTMPNTMNNSP